VYSRKSFSGNYEIISLTGNITCRDGEPWPHLHALFGDDQMAVVGGHLDQARVSATFECFITELGGPLNRSSVPDPQTGLFLTEPGS